MPPDDNIRTCNPSLFPSLLPTPPLPLSPSSLFHTLSRSVCVFVSLVLLFYLSICLSCLRLLV